MSGFASRLRATKYDSLDSCQSHQQRPARIETQGRAVSYAAGALWLFTMDFLEELLERLLKGFVLGSLVVFANEVATDFQCLEAELQS